MSKTVIIGGGIGGLATAIRLAAKKRQVILFEKNDYLGGKLAEYRAEGYRFDMGPSLFTMPSYLEELFAVAGRNMKDYLTYKQLDRSCHYFFPDGSSFVFYADKNNLKKEVSDKLDVSTAPLITYLNQSEKLYEKAGKLFVGGTVHPGGGIPLSLNSAKIVVDQI